MKDTDAISKALGLTPLDQLDQPIDLTPIQSPSENQTEQVKDDFEYARGNLISAIEKGQEALTGILDVASMSQHPRSYEVVATLLNSIVSANKDLLELQKRKKDLLKVEEGSRGGSTTNNLFVGSSAELLKLIKNKNKLPDTPDSEQ
jgi:hypothetical protein